MEKTYASGSIVSDEYKTENKRIVTVTKVESGGIDFSDGTVLYSNHDSDCCESHYLDFENLSMQDFEGLEFDLSNENFFERIPDFGIALNPLNGHPVRIPGYAYNNGYYSDKLDLMLINTRLKEVRKFDITGCQDWSNN